MKVEKSDTMRALFIAIMMFLIGVIMVTVSWGVLF